MNKKEIIKYVRSLEIKPDSTMYELCQKVPAKQIEHGANKYCIIASDYVIKWEHCNAESLAREDEIYKKAMRAGVADFFAKTEKLCTANKITFTIQEKLPYILAYRTPKNFNVNKCDTDYLTELEDILDCQDIEISRFWLEYALHYYGFNKCEKLCYFLIDNIINDLHDANIGFDANYLPKIFDFGGYSNGVGF